MQEIQTVVFHKTMDLGHYCSVHTWKQGSRGFVQDVVGIHSTKEGIKKYFLPYDPADAANRTGVEGDILHSKTHFSLTRATVCLMGH